jgi:hypothetical protein
VSDLLLLFVGLLSGALAASAILVPRLRAARGGTVLLEQRLASALQDRHELQAHLDATQSAFDARGTEIAAENAELRRRMDELADLIMERGGARRD